MAPNFEVRLLYNIYQIITKPMTGKREINLSGLGVTRPLITPQSNCADRKPPH